MTDKHPSTGLWCWKHQYREGAPNGRKCVWVGAQRGGHGGIAVGGLRSLFRPNGDKRPPEVQPEGARPCSMPYEPDAAAWPCTCRHASASRGKARVTGLATKLLETRVTFPL